MDQKFLELTAKFLMMKSDSVRRDTSLHVPGRDPYDGVGFYYDIGDLYSITMEPGDVDQIRTVEDLWIWFNEKLPKKEGPEPRRASDTLRNPVSQIRICAISPCM